MKPEYRVPSMEEVAKVRSTNGLSVVSTFSGCGGSCLGFEMAGYDVRYAVEFVPAAQEVYRINHPDTHLDTRDIREITADDILQTLDLRVGELDVLEGSPPCSSFSASGSRSKNWGEVKKYSDRKQRTDDLFFEYARLLRGLKPRAFVAENVPGLVRGVAKGYFIEIMKELKAAGYKVSAQILNARWLGVPQARQRLIFVGVRGDLGLAPAFPRPTPPSYAMSEVFGNDVEALVIGNPSHVQKEGSNFPRGIEFDMSVPCPTVQAGPRSIGGGNPAILRLKNGNTRPITIEELKRICSFPDDFVLTGSYAKQWERLGRSVPPLMMRAVAETLRDEVLRCVE